MDDIDHKEPELRPCPFCGGTLHLRECPLFGVWIPTEKFNQRPLEDALRENLDIAQLVVGELRGHLESAETERDALRAELETEKQRLWFWEKIGTLEGSEFVLRERADKAEAELEAAKAERDHIQAAWTKSLGKTSMSTVIEQIKRAEAAEARVRELEGKLAETSERNAALILRRIENEGELAILRGSLKFDSQEAMALAMDDMEGEVEDALAELHKANARITELEAEKASLESHFPRTADGVCVTPGMVVYLPDGSQWETDDQGLDKWAQDKYDRLWPIADCTANPPGDAEVTKS